jgi:uncharacterized repeat protein (TIGR02543 family)
VYTSTSDVPFKYRIVEVVPGLARDGVRTPGTPDSRIGYDPTEYHISISIIQDPVTGALTTANPDMPVVIDGGGPVLFTNMRVWEVSWDTNGGTSPAPSVVRVIHEESVTDKNTMPSDPTRPGYAFKGWFTQPAGGTAYDGTAPVIDDITLYAQWEAIEYTIIYDIGEHGTWNAADYTYKRYYDDLTPEGPDPDAYGNHDDHWFFVKWDITVSDKVTGSVTYTALWEEEGKYIISYYPGDG